MTWLRSLAAAHVALALVHGPGSARAQAAPPASDRDAPAPPRLVLADPDPELRRALTAALAPWHLEIVVSTAVPHSTGAAEQQARARDARFVVWRRGGDLVVFDRDRGAAELRDAPAGALDPASATAAALSVKTLLRLPPPGTAALTVNRAAAKPIQAPPAPVLGGLVRFQLGLGARLAGGSESALGTRGSLAVLVRPLPRHAWRIGVMGEAGTRTTLDGPAITGTASDASVLVVTTWAALRGGRRWALEPLVGLGAQRAALDGREAGRDRSERATLGLVRAGLALRYHRTGWSVGAIAAFDATLSPPTYTRRVGNAVLYDVPAGAGSLSVFAAFDVGP